MSLAFRVLPRMQTYPSRKTLISLKYEVTTPVLNAGQHVGVLGVHGVNHHKQIYRHKIGVARCRTLPPQWPTVPSIGKNVTAITCNGDVSIRVKKKIPQTNNIF